MKRAYRRHMWSADSVCGARQLTSVIDKLNPHADVSAACLPLRWNRWTVAHNFAVCSGLARIRREERHRRHGTYSSDTHKMTRKYKYTAAFLFLPQD